MNRAAGKFVMFIALATTTNALAAGNVASGQALYQGLCGLCHRVEKSRGDPLGPNLDGMASRKTAASEPGYDYSDALKNANLSWDDATLDKWLADPAALVPGTTMQGFHGIKDDNARADVIAYLDSLK